MILNFSNKVLHALAHAHCDYNLKTISPKRREEFESLYENNLDWSMKNPKDSRTPAQVRTQSYHGIAGQWLCEDKIPGIIETSPIVKNAGWRDKKPTDYALEGYRLELKGFSAEWVWKTYLSDSQYNSVLKAINENDFFVITSWQRLSDYHYDCKTYAIAAASKLKRYIEDSSGSAISKHFINLPKMTRDGHAMYVRDLLAQTKQCTLSDFMV